MTARRVFTGIAGVTLGVGMSIVSAIAQEPVIVLRAAWLIDATGRPPIADAVVLIRGNLIEAVGSRASVRVPSGAQVIDLPGQTLMPGLIDTHSHLVNRSMFPSLF